MKLIMLIKSKVFQEHEEFQVQLWVYIYISARREIDIFPKPQASKVAIFSILYLQQN
jgi:hypothetical protein